MLTVDRIDLMLNAAKELSIAQHQFIVDKIENMDRKIDHIEKNLENKIINLEKSSEEFQTWKNYMVAIVIVIGFIVPVITQYLWK